ncbi:sel1 repeat family protein [Streptomyces sp. NPDC058914]|uniref:sel1 repeat family protein n=1 Tax=Streptomyces sp. NPDC058914 TaxID=3346671 RepID=UPI0036C416BE
MCRTPLHAPEAEAPPHVAALPPRTAAAPEAVVPPPQTPTGDHVDFSHGTFHATVIGAQYNYPAAPTPVPPAGTWPQLRAVRRLSLGIRPVRRFGDESGLPPYVRRDADAVLDRIVGDRLRSGGLVVVTGEPLSGKSRSAWAALRRVGGSVRTRVHNAQPGTDLRGLPAALRGRERSGHHVVWLDDLAGHLGEQGLTAGLLAQCVHEGALVLATMRDEDYDTHRFGDGPTARVLSGAATVELSCRWSEAELARLAEAADPRLVDARVHRGALGVTQFLAVGPGLWEEWRRARRPSARPSGHELVGAAVDLARCGIASAVPSSMLAAWTGRSPAEDDLEWATRPRLAVSGLLVPGEVPDTWRASGPLVADALRSPDLPPVGPKGWLSAAEMARAHGLGDFGTVVRSGRTALRARGDEGDPDAMFALARLAGFAEDDGEARFWFRRLAEEDPGSALHFGRYLAQRGDHAEAVRQLEVAAEAGNLAAVRDLGPLLLDRAEHWLARAAASGSRAAATELTALREARAANRATVEE